MDLTRVIAICQSTPIALFKGMSFAEIDMAFTSLAAHERSFEKGQVILHAGDITREMGVVLEGSVTIENGDLWGNRTILAMAEAGDFFAEVYAILSSEPLLVDVRANEDCRVLFLRLDGCLKESDFDNRWRSKLMRNLLTIASRKNLALSERAFHTSPKTVRGRIMAYLESTALKKRSRIFDIPFNRQQLADYLNVERTALSKELGKMQRDGLIACSRNHFEILQA